MNERERQTCRGRHCNHRRGPVDEFGFATMYCMCGATRTVDTIAKDAGEWQPAPRRAERE
jgi:hypothetical protein